jgi:hypothetical protein
MARRQGKFLDWSASNPRAIQTPPERFFPGLNLGFLRERKIMLLRTIIVHHASQLHKVQATMSPDFLGPAASRA